MMEFNHTYTHMHTNTLAYLPGHFTPRGFEDAVVPELFVAVQLFGCCEHSSVGLRITSVRVYHLHTYTHTHTQIVQYYIYIQYIYIYIYIYIL